MLARTPDAVRLSFTRDEIDSSVTVAIHDLATRHLITFGALREMAQWLDTLGFRWRLGSNGIWER